MLRTLPEERKKKKPEKKKAASKKNPTKKTAKKKAPTKKTAQKKTATKKTPKKKTDPKKTDKKKTESKKKTPVNTKKSLTSKIPPTSAEEAKQIVRYKDGTTSTYGEFLEQFEARVRYIMQLNEIKYDSVEKIVYVNSSTAGLTMTDGKKRFLSIGKEAESKP